MDNENLDISVKKATSKMKRYNGDNKILPIENNEEPMNDPIDNNDSESRKTIEKVVQNINSSIKPAQNNIEVQKDPFDKYKNAEYTIFLNEGTIYKQRIEKFLNEKVSVFKIGKSKVRLNNKMAMVLMVTSLAYLTVGSIVFNILDNGHRSGFLNFTVPSVKEVVKQKTEKKVDSFFGINSDNESKASVNLNKDAWVKVLKGAFSVNPTEKFNASVLTASQFNQKLANWKVGNLDSVDCEMLTRLDQPWVTPQGTADKPLCRKVDNKLLIATYVNNNGVRPLLGYFETEQNGLSFKLISLKNATGSEIYKDSSSGQVIEVDKTGINFKDLFLSLSI